jgi:hypothetical protein
MHKSNKNSVVFNVLSWSLKNTNIMRYCICRNYIALQLVLKKNSYVIIMQLSFGYYNYYAIIPLEIWGINK